jgi:hypothetical protein
MPDAVQHFRRCRLKHSRNEPQMNCGFNLLQTDAFRLGWPSPYYDGIVAEGLSETSVRRQDGRLRGDVDGFGSVGRATPKQLAGPAGQGE